MPALLPILAAVWSFASSQVGVLMIVAAVAFGYGHHKASVACDEKIATEHARALQLHTIEMARQAKAAEAIAMVDRNRAGLANMSANAMQAEIDSLKAELLKKGNGNAKAGGCVVDGDFVKRVRKLDGAGRR